MLVYDLMLFLINIFDMYTVGRDILLIDLLAPRLLMAHGSCLKAKRRHWPHPTPPVAAGPVPSLGHEPSGVRHEAFINHLFFSRRPLCFVAVASGALSLARDITFTKSNISKLINHET